MYTVQSRTTVPVVHWCILYSVLLSSSLVHTVQSRTVQWCIVSYCPVDSSILSSLRTWCILSSVLLSSVHWCILFSVLLSSTLVSYTVQCPTVQFIGVYCPVSVSYCPVSIGAYCPVSYCPEHWCILSILSSTLVHTVQCPTVHCCTSLVLSSTLVHTVQCPTVYTVQCPTVQYIGAYCPVSYCPALSIGAYCPVSYCPVHWYILSSVLLSSRLVHTVQCPTVQLHWCIQYIGVYCVLLSSVLLSSVLSSVLLSSTLVHTVQCPTVQ